MDDFVGEDGELFRDPEARDSSPEHGDLPSHGGNHGSASKPRKRFLIKGGGGGVRYRDGREDLGERDAGLQGGGVDRETGGGLRKRKWSSGLSDHHAQGCGPEKHNEKRRKEGRRVGREEGEFSSDGKGFYARGEEQDEGERDTITAAGSEAEKDKEHDLIDQLFESGWKKKNDIIEEFMAEFEIAYEDDANLNGESKPGNNKRRKLPLLVKVLSKTYLQKVFLDHGILTLLKNWLEPLPDGIMESVDIRAAILKILTDFTIDLDQLSRRKQLKKSGLGKVIMLLSKSSEETAANRELAKALIEKWSRPVKSTGFEDMSSRPPQMKKPTASSSSRELRGDHHDADFSQRRSGQGSSWPETSPLDFAMCPKSRDDPEQIRADAKQVAEDQHWQLSKEL